MAGEKLENRATTKMLQTSVALTGHKLSALQKLFSKSCVWVAIILMAIKIGNCDIILTQFVAFTSAPFSTKDFTTSTCPLQAAAQSSVAFH